MAAVPADLRREPVLNDYAYGGYLIGQGLRPYVDGRAELYGEDFLRAYGDVSSGDRKALAAELDRRAICWTLLAAGRGRGRARLLLCILGDPQRRIILVGQIECGIERRRQRTQLRQRLERARIVADDLKILTA